MVHDLWESEPSGEYYANPKWVNIAQKYGTDIFKNGDIGVKGYGYPDPVRTAKTQAEAAQERGEEPPLTPERMAHDVYFYEVDRRSADVRWIFPSFEERYGYPDPRPRLPEDERPDPQDP
jgi:hypothetical protein